MPTMYDGRDYQWIKARREVYAQKLLKLGIIKDSNKWRTLMCRKGL